MHQRVWWRTLISVGLLLTTGLVPGEARAALPDDAELFTGKWVGQVKQSDKSSPETVEVDLYVSNDKSTLEGHLKYPAGECEGDLSIESGATLPRQILTREHITVNAWDGIQGHSGCLEWADVKLTAVGDAPAFDLQFIETTPANSITVEGTLTLAASAPVETQQADAEP